MKLISKMTVLFVVFILSVTTSHSVTRFKKGPDFLMMSYHSQSPYTNSCYTGHICRNFYGASGASVCGGAGSTLNTEKCPPGTALGACTNIAGSITIETVYYQGGGCNAASCAQTCRAGGGTWSVIYGGL